jgi:DsbC/DsbD-like thiol-disulfide interchange protein
MTSSWLLRSETAAIAGLCATLMLNLMPAAQATGGAGLHQQPSQRSASDVTRVRLMADVDRIAPGATFQLLIVFDIQPRWHLYWKNPGAGAAAPHVRITAPEGFEVGRTRWPRPIVLGSPTGDMYSYEGQIAIFVPLTAPSAIDDASATFKADISWAVCEKDICLLGNVKQEIELRVSGSVNASADPLIERHSARLPINARASADASASFDGETLTITGPAHGFTSAVFLPGSAPGIRYGEPRLMIDNDRFTLTVEVTVGPTRSTRPRIVGGLVMLGTKHDDPSYEAEVDRN